MSSSSSSQRLLRRLVGRSSSSSAASLAAAAAVATGTSAAAFYYYSDDDSVHAVRRVMTATKHLVPVYFDYRRHVARVNKIKSELDSSSSSSSSSAMARSVLLEELQRESRQELWMDVAVRLRDLARENGGIYVKAGQHLCVQPVAPLPFRQILRVLMDDASSRPFEEDEKTFSEEFDGLKPRDVFLEFDEKPIASASLAQVYKAKTKMGEDVAVKIQQRPVARFLWVDLATIETYYAVLGYLIPGLRFAWLAKETRRHMTEELDFRLEAKNCKDMGRLLKEECGFKEEEVTVPKIHDSLSTKRVLTMEFADGTRVDNVEKMRENKVDAYKVAKTIQEAFATLTFEHGFAHGDPHPGNLLVDKNGKVTILDHGVVRRLDEPTRETWCQVWLALIRNDENEMRNAVEKLGINPEMHKFFGIILALAPARVIEDRFKKADSSSTSSSRADEVVVTENKRASTEPTTTRENETNNDSLSMSDKREIFRTVLKVKLEDQSKLFESLPRDLLMVLKANNLLRYVNEQLGSPVNRYRIIARSAKNGLEKRERMKNDAERELEISSARKKGFGYRTKEWARTVKDRGYDNVMVMLLPAQLFFTRGKLAWAFWRSSKAAKSSAILSSKSTVASTTTAGTTTERKAT
jgi:aarF domain-containing kinase